MPTTQSSAVAKEAQLAGASKNLGAALHVELDEDRVQVPLDRAEGDMQILADLPVRGALDNRYGVKVREGVYDGVDTLPKQECAISSDRLSFPRVDLLGIIGMSRAVAATPL